MSSVPIMINLAKDNYERIMQNANNENMKVEEYVEKIVVSTMDRIFFIGEYSYNLAADCLENQGKEIKLTKKEKEFIKYLINNTDRYISLEELRENVWKKENTTIYSMRNIPNKIRLKTCRELIRNKSGYGYKLNIKNIIK